MSKKKHNVKKRTAGNRSRFWRGHFKPMLLLAVLTFIVYGNTLRNGYTYDDKPFTSQNYIVQQGFKGIPTLLVTDFWAGYTGVSQTNPSYRPLPLVTLAIGYQLWGLSPGADHFLNVLLYALTCILLFVLLKMVFRDAYVMLPLLAAVLFCVHPIHTEVVASVKGRDDLLALIGGLLALYFLLRHAELHRRRLLIAALVSYFLALMSKEHVMMWVAIVPLTLYFLTSLPTKRIVGISTAFLGVSLLYYAIRASIVGTQIIRHTDVIDNPILGASGIAEAWATKMAVAGLFIQKLLVPYPLRSDYGYEVITTTNWSSPVVYLSIAVYGVLLFLAVKGLRTKKLYAYASALFLLTLVPVSHVLFYHTIAFAERSMYTPSVGFTLLLALAICRVEETTRAYPRILRHVFAGIVVSALTIYAGITLARNPAWKSDMALFSTDIRTTPHSVRLNLLYAQELITRNTGPGPVPMNQELEEARTSISRALALVPDLARAHLLYGNLYKGTGNYAESERAYLEAESLDPLSPTIQFNLGLMAQVREDLDEAKARYLRSLEIFPNYAAALSNLGVIYGSQNQIDQCIDVLEKSFMLEPNRTVAQNLGQAYTIKGNHFKAKYYADIQRRLPE